MFAHLGIGRHKQFYMKKNYLYLLAMVMVAMFSFASCSSDDDDSNGSGDIEKKLVGKWQLTQAVVDGVKENPNDPYSTCQTCDYKGWAKYNADGTAENYDYCEKITEKGTWKIKDGKLIAVGTAFPIEFGVQIRRDSPY